MKGKNPWIAAFLNLIFPGIGYLYIGKRKWFAYILIAAMVSGIIADIEYIDLNRTDLITLLLSGFLWFFAFAYDAYAEAKLMNKKSG